MTGRVTWARGSMDERDPDVSLTPLARAVDTYGSR